MIRESKMTEQTEAVKDVKVSRRNSKGASTDSFKHIEYVMY